MIRLIDNKRIELTEDEHKAYQEICRSYDRPNFQGKDLFKDLFETDDKGHITFLKPPNKSFTSMEVLIFLQNIMVHQHLRMMYDDVDEAVKKVNEKVSILETLENKLKALFKVE